MGEPRRKRTETIYDACRNGNNARVLEYIEKGGCLSDFDDNHMTMLHHSAFAGSMELVEAILGAGSSAPPQHVELDSADKDGWTALHYAADQGHTTVVSRLLDEGASVNSRDANKRTPLHLTALAGHADVCKVLLANGASKSAKNIAGMTPAECAKAAGQEPVVFLLE